MSLIPSLFGNSTNRSSTSLLLDPFANEIWDPLRSLSVMIRNPPTPIGSIISIDWKETEEAHIIKADLPGLKKEEVKLEVEDGKILHISGERNEDKEDKNDKWHRVERSHGKFIRKFSLPENAKVEEVKATMDNGVLTITIPKEEIKKPQPKAIQISG